jgi:type III restriction enzyme
MANQRPSSHKSTGVGKAGKGPENALPVLASPILNGPYSEPALHYATAADGTLNYQDSRAGRRIFAPQTPQVPLGKQPQGSIFDVNDFAAQYREELVNLLRTQLAAWRNTGYPDVTSRVTRDLLTHWFQNPYRPDWKKLFFAQQEAVEAAIWLNEVAHKFNAGIRVLNVLRQANETVQDANRHEKNLALAAAGVCICNAKCLNPLH